MLHNILINGVISINNWN